VAQPSSIYKGIKICRVTTSCTAEVSEAKDSFDLRLDTDKR